jgi:hypothetical protein
MSTWTNLEVFILVKNLVLQKRLNMPRNIAVRLPDVPKLAEIDWLGGSPADEWNETWETFLLYITFTFFSCKPLQTSQLNRSARTILGVALIRNYILRSKPPENFKFLMWMPNFQPNQNTRITVERYEIDEKYHKIAHTKLGSENHTVTSYLL